MANNVITNLTVDGAVETKGGTVSSGVDTQSGVALTVPKGNYIKSDDGNYLRNIIGHNSSGNIEIGQSGTALISNIELKPGSSGNVSFFTTGSESFRVDSSGRVGMGTTSPTQRLEVIGTIKQKAGAGYTNYVQQSVSEAQLTFTTSSVNQTSFPSAIKFAPNGIEAVRIDNAGQVGIGTPTPNAQLTVGDGTINSNIKTFFSDGTYTEITGYGVQFDRGTSYLRPTANNVKNLYIGSGSNTWATLRTDATSHWFNGNGVNHMFIASDGDVGIGTTSPSAKLDVRGKIQNNAVIESESGGTSSYIAHSASTDTHIAIAGRVDSYPAPSTNSSSIVTTRDGGAYPFNSYGHLVLSSRHDAARDILFRTNDTDRVVIQGDGDVGIGTTSPSVQLDIEDSGNVLIDLNTTTANANTTIRFQEAGANTATIGYDGTADGLVLANGGFTAGNGIFIDGSNRVGVGTTSPSQKLDVNGNVNVSGAVQVGSVIANGSSFDVYIGGVRVMTIDSAGNAHFKGDVTGNSTTV